MEKIGVQEIKELFAGLGQMMDLIMLRLKVLESQWTKGMKQKGGGEELLLKFFIHMVFKTHCYKQIYSDKQLTHTTSLYSSPNIMNCLHI